MSSSAYSSDADSDPGPPQRPKPPTDKKSKVSGVSKDDLDDWLGSSSSDGDDDLLLRRQAKLQLDPDEFFQDDGDGDGAASGANLVDFEAPAVDFDSVRDRASAIILTLQDLKRLGAAGLSRSDYLGRLYEDLCLLFQYNRWLMEKLCSLVKTSEILDFIEANERPRPVVLRTNSLRTRRKELKRVLNERGVRLGEVGSWTKAGLIVFESQVPLGSTPEYLAGHYMLQSPSSFLPVMGLNPQREMRILDMCAAPGGKTTHIAQLMRNTRVDESDGSFQHNCGVFDGRTFSQVMGGFDRVLLDGCDWEGFVSKNE
jgi:ribosomal RNA methyltransferase Nop2